MTFDSLSSKLYEQEKGEMRRFEHILEKKRVSNHDLPTADTAARACTAKRQYPIIFTPSFMLL